MSEAPLPPCWSASKFCTPSSAMGRAPAIPGSAYSSRAPAVAERSAASAGRKHLFGWSVMVPCGHAESSAMRSHSVSTRSPGKSSSTSRFPPPLLAAPPPVNLKIEPQPGTSGGLSVHLGPLRSSVNLTFWQELSLSGGSSSTQ